MLEPVRLTRTDAAATESSILSVQSLVKLFPVPGKFWRVRGSEYVHAVDGVTLDIYRSEVIAIVGESGSGKTTVAHCIAGFLMPTEGSILFNGKVISAVKNGKARRYMGRPELARNIQVVLQDPSSALNPRQKVGQALMEPVLAHGIMPKAHAQAWKKELLDLVGLPQTIAESYPHELDSGERQRVVIARALTLRPKVIVADEAVSRLDVSMQSQILNLLLKLRRELQLTIVFITHDLSVVRQIADRVVVMYLGKIMEIGSADDFFLRTSHPYALGLLRATPRLSGSIDADIIAGEIPSAVHPPAGCPFVTRCPESIEDCKKIRPPLKAVATDHLSACIRR